MEEKKQNRGVFVLLIFVAVGLGFLIFWLLNRSFSISLGNLFGSKKYTFEYNESEWHTLDEIRVKSIPPGYSANWSACRAQMNEKNVILKKYLLLGSETYYSVDGFSENELISEGGRLLINNSFSVDFTSWTLESAAFTEDPYSDAGSSPLSEDAVAAIKTALESGNKREADLKNDAFLSAVRLSLTFAEAPGLRFFCMIPADGYIAYKDENGSTAYLGLDNEKCRRGEFLFFGNYYTAGEKLAAAYSEMFGSMIESRPAAGEMLESLSNRISGGKRRCIASSRDNFICITSDGKVKVAGSGFYDVSIPDSAEPVSVYAGDKFVSVLLSDGRVLSFGEDGYVPPDARYSTLSVDAHGNALAGIDSAGNFFCSFSPEIKNTENRVSDGNLTECAVGSDGIVVFRTCDGKAYFVDMFTRNSRKDFDGSSVSVCAGDGWVASLDVNGNVRLGGRNSSSVASAGRWGNIARLYPCGDMLVGVGSDGKVHAAGPDADRFDLSGINYPSEIAGGYGCLLVVGNDGAITLLGEDPTGGAIESALDGLRVKVALR